MTRKEESVALFASGRNCCQSVLTPYAREFFKNPDDAARVAAGFEAGIASRGELCGAVTGALMALGLKYGHGSPYEKPRKMKLQKCIKIFMKEFEERCGAVHCNKLLKVDISTNEGIQEAMDKNLFSTVCLNCLQTSTEILDRMFEEQS